MGDNAISEGLVDIVTYLPAIQGRNVVVLVLPPFHLEATPTDRPPLLLAILLIRFEDDPLRRSCRRMLPPGTVEVAHSAELVSCHCKPRYEFKKQRIRRNVYEF